MKFAIILLITSAAVAVTGQYCTCRSDKYDESSPSNCEDCSVPANLQAKMQHYFKGYWNTTEEKWMEKPIAFESNWLSNNPKVILYEKTVWAKKGSFLTDVFGSWEKLDIVQEANEYCDRINTPFNASDTKDVFKKDKCKVDFFENPKKVGLKVNTVHAANVYQTSELLIPVMQSYPDCTLGTNLQYGADQSLRTYLLEKKYVTTTEDQFACYGQGTWLHMSHSCDCSTGSGSGTGSGSANLDPAEYCGKCKDGYIDWPSCTLKACDGTDSCNGRGSCDKSAFYKTFKGFGFSTYSAALLADKALHTSPITSSMGAYCSGTNDNGLNVRWKLSTVVDGRKCCNDGINGFCEWDEECAEGRKCIKSGYEVCESERKDPLNGKTLINACSPAETCCHGECCNSNQACQEIQGGNPGGTQILGQDAEKLARMDWTYLGTEVPEDYRYKCTSSDTMDAAAVIKSWVTPFFIMLAIGVSATLVLVTDGLDLGEKKITIPALIVLFCSLILLFSKQQFYAIGASLGSIFAIGAQKSQAPNRFLFSLFFQFLFLVMLSGGLNMGYLFVSGKGQTSVTSGITQSACQQFFSAFEYDADTKPWDSSDEYYGHCSEAYVAAVQFFSTVMYSFFFIQTVATGAVLATGNQK